MKISYSKLNISNKKSITYGKITIRCFRRF